MARPLLPAESDSCFWRECSAAGSQPTRQGREGSTGGGQAHIDEPAQELDGSSRDCHSAALERHVEASSEVDRATGSPSLAAGSLSSPGGMRVHSVQHQVRTGKQQQHRGVGRAVTQRWRWLHCRGFSLLNTRLRRLLNIFL